MADLVAVATDCDWPVDAACFEDEWDAFEDDVRDRALSMASATMYRLTGYRVGGCPVTVRPCKAACFDGCIPGYYDLGFGSAGFWPHINVGGVWVNSCGHTGSCSCSGPLDAVQLPRPIGRLDSVKIDGDEIDLDTVRVYKGNLIDLTGGRFPVCQNLALPDDQPGTFSVTYLNSHPVDTNGAFAATVLAREFAKACTDDNSCRLPANVTQVVRAGVTIDVVSGTFPDGVTGIQEIDAYIGLWNPKGIREQTRVWYPGMRRY